MSPTVHLHIGEPKSGTTYVQSVLTTNQERLRDAGLFVPDSGEQIRASQDAIRGKEGGTLWRDMAAALLAWSGSDALVSMETLCRANESAVNRALEALAGAEIRVHITVRDVLRSLPAQWQQSTQHRKTWSWSEYCTAVIDNDPGHPAVRNFWSQHDLAAIVATWANAVGADRVYVTTVPRSGADPELLWQRFSQALGLNVSNLEFAGSSNESLGATSAELLRRLNIELESADLTEKQYNIAVRKTLARQVLASRRNSEPKVQLPEAAGVWAEREAERLVAAVIDSGVNVVGDLNEIRPQAGALVHRLEPPSDQELVDTAISAVSGLVRHIARNR